MKHLKNILLVVLICWYGGVQCEEKLHEQYDVDNVSNNVQDTSDAENEPYVIDTIHAVIFGQEGVELITHSDLARPSLTGMMQSLDDLIFESLVYLDAVKFHVLPDDDTINRYLAAIERENNLQPGEIDALFGHAGYTVQEGREQLKRMQAVNSMFDFKIRSNLIVARKDIEKYYNDNPEIKEAVYTLQYTLMPFGIDKEKQKQELCTIIKTGNALTTFSWSVPFSVSKNDIVEDKDFIYSLRKGEMSEPIEVVDGFEIYYLKDKEDERLKTFEERRSDIINILQRPKYMQLLNEYKVMLLQNASILYL